MRGQSCLAGPVKDPQAHPILSGWSSGSQKTQQQSQDSVQQQHPFPLLPGPASQTVKESHALVSLELDPDPWREGQT